MTNSIDTSGDVVELSSTDGVAFIEQASPLTRLHYFDGQFLRASSLTTEQDYHRHAAQLTNLAGGWGVVHGFGIALAGDQLSVKAGLAITPAGHFVLAGSDMKAKLADLLGSAKPAPAPGTAAFDTCLEAKSAPTATASTGLQVYEITVGPIEGLCGNEAVFGKLCETACATDSRRPFWREGVVLRLRPVNLTLPSSSSIHDTTTHQRNRIASAYFRNEPGQPNSLLSAAGLASGVWCEPAQMYSRDEVVIGLLWRDAGVARVDAWSGRQERMDTQARNYWQGRMAMRPWNVFIAQILQFQCQLSGLFEANSPVLQPGDDCERIRAALGDARAEIEALLKRFQGSSKGLLLKSGERETFKRLQDASAAFKSSYADLTGLSDMLAGLDVGSGAKPKKRMLLNGGFFDLPPAGYLPVSVGSDVADQCERMFGEGVALHYHAVRHDEIAHLVEEAEHLDRISLTRGLDDPSQIEQVEVFVPEGQTRLDPAKSSGIWWTIRLDIRALDVLDFIDGAESEPQPVPAQPAPPPAVPAQPAPGLVGKKSRAKAQAAPTAAASVEAAGDAMSDAARQRVARGSRVFDGLIRTEAREDGSFGFTTVFGAELAEAVEKDGVSTGSAVTLDYFSGDVAQDPFTLATGGTTACSLEFASASPRGGDTVALRGRLTVLRQRAAADGTQERLVQLDFDVSQQFMRAGQTRPATRSNGRIRLMLQRDGDQRTGVFLIDDEREDPKTGAVVFDWSDAPRRASLSVTPSEKRKPTDKPVDPAKGLRGLAIDDLSDILRDRIERAAAHATASASSLVEARQRLMDMAALPGMPELGSDLATEALNRLAVIAEVIDDGAFLLRARQRLLPTLDAPKAQSIQAATDWVMFRRARTHLCGPACSTTPTRVIETFQVWHLKTDDAQALARLQKALESGDSKTLATFKFSRVGLLRYRDESAFAEESDAQVLAMWRAAQPAARVVLGRVWELAPQTGQGWQNHMRMRHMLKSIDSLTQVPPVGDGSLQVLAPPVGELNDPAVDGGMLIVTAPAEVKTAFHRVVMVTWGVYADLLPLVKEGSEAAVRRLDDLLLRTTAVHADLDMHFQADGSLLPADLEALKKADQTLRATEKPLFWEVHAALLDTKPAPADVHPDGQHQRIGNVLGVVWQSPPTGGDDGVNTVSAPRDFGRGSSVLSLVGYNPINEDK